MSARIDRLLRWVWLINGVLLLALVVIAILFVAGAWITDLTAGGDAVPVAAEAGADSGGARPRAVRYDAPRPIRGTDTRIVLIRQGEGYRPSAGSYSSPRASEGPIVNVGFVGEGGGGLLLLDRPAYVARVRWPGGGAADDSVADAALRWVVYEMALEDGSGDGRLDHRDPRTLYLSGLDGGGLRRVLPAGFRLRDWEVRDDGSLFVTAYSGAPPGADEDELARHAFLVGADGQARPFAALDSLAAAAGRILRR